MQTLLDFSNPYSKSAIKSSTSSIPTDTLIISGDTPANFCSSSFNCAWVVLAGCITKDFASATLAKWEKIFKDSMNILPASTPPLIPNVNIDPAPLGQYFLANSLYLLFSSPG